MLFIIIGILLLAASFIVIRPNPQTSRYARVLEIGAVGLMILGTLSLAVVEIGPGEVGVQTLFGKVEQRTLVSGLNTVNPLVKVTKYDVRTQNYTMSEVHTEGDVTGDDAIRILSADGLEVKIDLTVLYSVIPADAPRIYQSIGTDYKDKIVRPITRTKIRDNAVYYDAVQLYSTKRDEFQSKIYNSIKTEFANRGLLLENLLVRNISLPQSVKASIESKINAEQESQKMQYVLSKEKQEADRKRVEAQGIADYQKIISAELTDKQLQYEQIKAQKEIATSPNTKVIIMGGKSSSLMINTQ